MVRFPTFFLSHGGGPWPFVEMGLPPEMCEVAEDSLREADEREAAARLDTCPGCDGCGRVHELSAILCATCGGSGRASLWR